MTITYTRGGMNSNTIYSYTRIIKILFGRFDIVNNFIQNASER